MIALSIFLIVLGQQVGDRLGLLIGCFISLGINGFIYYYGYLKLQRVFGGHQLEGQDPWGLLNRLSLLANRAKLPPPSLRIIPLETPTSFSAGQNWNRSSILLSDSLLETFSADEVEAVMAYEIARVKRHDTVILGAATAFARGILWLPETIEQHLPSQPILRALGRGIHFFFMVLLAPFAALFLRLAVRSRDYFAADYQAGQMINN